MISGITHEHENTHNSNISTSPQQQGPNFVKMDQRVCQKFEIFQIVQQPAILQLQTIFHLQAVTIHPHYFS